MQLLKQFSLNKFNFSLISKLKKLMASNPAFPSEMEDSKASREMSLQNIATKNLQ